MTERVLKTLFYELYVYRIDLEGIILKPNMVIAGTNADDKDTIEEVAAVTVKCLLESVPAIVPAIAFLSGGQSPEKATAHLNAMNKRFKNQVPWILTFSFARAIQQPALELWKGQQSHVEEAQKVLYKRAKCAGAARRGEYIASMEKTEAAHSTT